MRRVGEAYLVVYRVGQRPLAEVGVEDGIDVHILGAVLEHLARAAYSHAEQQADEREENYGQYRNEARKRYPESAYLSGSLGL